MRKAGKWIALAAVVAVFVYMLSVASDKKQLSDEILRLHVVANSDSAEDQAVKLQVRDAVLGEVEKLTAGAACKEEAQRLLSGELEKLEQAANTVLEANGFMDRAKVTLAKEAFPVREYDTFSLPSGVYDSLRVTIGEAQGRNWWCVVFPSLCIPAASEGVEDTAAGAGFSDSLSGAITGEPQYEVRFFLLDVWGRLENLFWKG